MYAQTMNMWDNLCHRQWKWAREREGKKKLHFRCKDCVVDSPQFPYYEINRWKMSRHATMVQLQLMFELMWNTYTDILTQTTFGLLCEQFPERKWIGFSVSESQFIMSITFWRTVLRNGKIHLQFGLYLYTPIIYSS